MLGWKGESGGFPDVYSSIQRMNETLTGPWGRHRPGSGNRRLRCVKCVLDWLGAHFWSGGWGLGGSLSFLREAERPRPGGTASHSFLRCFGISLCPSLFILPPRVPSVLRVITENSVHIHLSFKQ